MHPGALLVSWWKVNFGCARRFVSESDTPVDGEYLSFIRLDHLLPLGRIEDWVRERGGSWFNWRIVNVICLRAAATSLACSQCLSSFQLCWGDMTAEMSMSMFDLLLDKLEGGIVKSESLNQEKIHSDVMVSFAYGQSYCVNEWEFVT